MNEKPAKASQYRVITPDGIFCLADINNKKYRNNSKNKPDSKNQQQTKYLQTRQCVISKNGHERGPFFFDETKTL